MGTVVAPGNISLICHYDRRPETVQLNYYSTFCVGLHPGGCRDTHTAEDFREGIAVSIGCLFPPAVARSPNDRTN
jgi:hypothetical protein